MLQEKDNIGVENQCNLKKTKAWFLEAIIIDHHLAHSLSL